MTLHAQCFGKPGILSPISEAPCPFIRVLMANVRTPSSSGAEKFSPDLVSGSFQAIRDQMLAVSSGSVLPAGRGAMCAVEPRQFRLDPNRIR